MKLTHTQRCVLKVMRERGSTLRWSFVTDEVRRRSGRTVRPSYSTLVALVDHKLVDVDGPLSFSRARHLSISLTPLGTLPEPGEVQ